MANLRNLGAGLQLISQVLSPTGSKVKPWVKLPDSKTLQAQKNLHSPQSKFTVPTKSQ